LWVANALGTLLEAAPQLPKGVMRTAFRQNLQWLVERFAGGNLTGFAQGISMSFFVLDTWLRDECLPCLDGLLQLCEKLNIKPINLLLPDELIRGVDTDRMEKLMRDGRGNRKLFPNRAEIRREMQAATKEFPPPSVTHIAQRLGFLDVASLYQVDANLCKHISKNYRRSADSYWWRRRGAKPICSAEKMKKTLKAALTADNPPSTKHLSRRLGYADDRLMRKRFPALCAGISAKRRKWKAGLSARIQPSIEKALLEDQPPSLLEIARQNGIGTVATLKKYCPALKRKLSARQAAFRNVRNAQRRAALEQAFTESPVPSLADVAKRLRVSRARLREQFHDLCAALGKRYRMGAQKTQ
jgi:AraC-like DNA-binding protein